MGAYQNNTQGNGKGKGRRGSVRNQDRLEAFARPQPEGGGDWGSCNPELMQSVVVGITEMSGAVIFGLSKNQGAHTLTLLLDERKQTMYFNGDADLDTELQGVIDILKQIS